MTEGLLSLLAEDGAEATPDILRGVLEDLRSEVSRIDAELFERLSVRFSLARQIGEVKALLDLPAYDPAREVAVYAEALKHTDGGVIATVVAAMLGVSRLLVAEAVSEGGRHADRGVR